MVSSRDSYHHALVVFDQAWEGAPAKNPLALEEHVRQQLGDEGWADVVVIDPDDPKKAVEQALRTTGKPRSSAIYRKLAQRVSIERCTDEAFARLRARLGAWFAPKAP